MIVLVEERSIVRDGFAAMFNREGLPSLGFSSAEFDDWLAATSNAEIDAVEMLLIGDGVSELTLVRLRERCMAPIVALIEARELDRTLRLFAAGCDDVVRKPVHARELMARAAAIRCRRRGEADRAFRLGRLVVHADGRDPEVDGEPMPLPRRERRVLEVLAAARGRRVTKPQLYSAVYGELRTDIEECVIESHVSKLRKKLRAKLGDDPVNSRRFLGYAIEAVGTEQAGTRAAA